MLVTVARYQAITADSASPTAAIEDAQALLEEYLRRPLEKASRTERVRVIAEPRGPVLYPSATPLVSVSDPSGATIVGTAILGGSAASGAPYFLTDPDAFQSVTYIGGFDPAATSGPTRLPRTLERAIAWAAYAISNPADFAAAVPSGVTSASVGDVSLAWGPGGSPATGEVSFSSGLVRRYRRRLEFVS